jgi:hypothetical protein
MLGLEYHGFQHPLNDCSPFETILAARENLKAARLDGHLA